MTALKNESGRTMLEMLGVLAIMGVIVYGAVAGIGFGIEVYKVNASYTDLEELSQGIIDLYSWSDDYSGLNCKVLRDNDVTNLTIGDDASNVGSCRDITGRYGTILVSTQQKPPKFFIQYDGLTSFACGRLRNMDYTNLKRDDSLEHKQCEDGTLYLKSL